MSIVGRSEGAKAGLRRRRRIGLAILVMVTLTILAASASWIASQRSSAWTASGPDSSFASAAAGQDLAALAGSSYSAPRGGFGRVVYPYSVIPGGVRSPEELRRATEHDQVAASHFAGFDYDHAKVVQLAEPKLVYLSYRMGGRIFWTKKKVRLCKGEKVLTDGKLTARTRCANRVSESAQKAVSPEEPPAEKFEEPILGGGTATEAPYPGAFESALASRPQFPEVEPLAPAGLGGGLLPPTGSGGYPPIFPPPIPSGGGGKPPGPPPPPPPPPTTVPEPGSIFLMASGAAAIYLRYRKSSK